ncbi:MAG: flavodoxin family protein, partial [Actinobacteria bacterium]
MASRPRWSRWRRSRTRAGCSAGPSVPEAAAVLGIAGSPRRHGNSERMLDAALEGAREAGAATAAIVAAEPGIEPCRGCNACSLTGECVIRDRMREVYAALDSAGALVIASPVFFA